MNIKNLIHKMKAITEGLERAGSILVDPNSKWYYMEADDCISFEFIPELNNDTLRIRKINDEYVMDKVSNSFSKNKRPMWKFNTKEELIDGVNRKLQDWGIDTEAPTEELIDLLDNKKVTESFQEDISELAEQSIYNINEILNHFKTNGEGDMDDMKTLEAALEVLEELA